MSEEETAGEVLKQRQWVALRGGSLDVRGGKGICGHFARDLRTAIGKPHDCALLSEAGTPSGLVEAVHRDFSDQGYTVHAHQMPDGACDLAQVERLDRVLAESGITADDAVVVLGGLETLSVASFACSSWCGGVSLVEVPLDAPSAIVAAPTPRALDLPGLPRVVSQEGSARFSIVDVGAFETNPASEEMRHAFALMVAAAMCVMETLEQAQGGAEATSFTAGNLSIRTEGAARRRAGLAARGEGLLAPWMAGGGFSFRGVRG